MNLIKLLILFSPLMIIAQKDCSKLTIGEFKPAYGPYKYNYEITRTDSTQIDFDKVLGTESKFKIIWINDCEYKLKRISGKGYREINGFDMKLLTFQIDSINNDGFRYLVLYPEENILVDTTELLRIE